jgi:hypothetical protein
VPLDAGIVGGVEVAPIAVPTKTAPSRAEAAPTERPSDDPADAVESALAAALELAAKAGRFDVVAILARHLDERWRARVAPGVASIDGARAKRDG